MKALSTLVAFLLFSIATLAQTNGINYKALIKDGNGNVVQNTSTTIEFTVYKGAGLFNTYRETHTVFTDSNGILVANIGEGTTVNGVFEDVNWSDDDYFLGVKVDTGDGYVDLGITAFKTVPYAIQAAKAAKATTAETAEIANNVSGLEAINEGNGIGYRLIGRDPERYRNIGFGATDLSDNYADLSPKGAAGSHSFATGFRTLASGTESTSMGSFTIASGNQSTALGYFTTALGDESMAFGYNTYAPSYSEMVVGSKNTFYTPISATSWEATDRLFVIGNAAAFSTNSDALIVLKNGTITAPSLDISEITDDKALITKEYADTNLSNSGLEAINEVNGVGYRLVGRNPNNYGVIGSEAIDLTFSAFSSGTIGATGNFAFASGYETTASGDYSTSFGFGTLADAVYSASFGYNTSATGFYATSFGLYTNANAHSSMALGRYNVGGGNISNWVTTDPLFEVGNGTSNSAKSNALTILKNGKVGITTATPNTKLHITNGGDASLASGSGFFVIGDITGANMVLDNNEIIARNNGATSPLYLQNHGGNVAIGFLTPNVALDVAGSIEYTGTITDVSDRRLKENFKPIDNVLERLQHIEGYTYNMINDETKAREYGVIAQELQKVFPEMVSVIDTEKGYLGVSYIQLIPVLINAIKEQQDIIDNQEKSMSQYQKTLTNVLSRVENLETNQSN